MGKKKKNVPTSAAAESSRNADSKAIENMKSLNSELSREAEEHRKDIEQLRRQLAAATEMIETAAVDLHAAEMRLLVAVRDTDEKKKELADLKESFWSLEQASQSATTWKKWLYPAAASATFCVVAAAVTMCCRNSRCKS